MCLKIVTDKGLQFTGSEFKNVRTFLFIDHTATSPYQSIPNGQAERFVDSVKRALRKNPCLERDERSTQKFSSMYRIVTNSNMSQAKLVSARRVRSIFDRMLSSLIKKNVKKKSLWTNFSNSEKNFFLKDCRCGNNSCEDRIITWRLGKVTYMLKGK